MTKIRMVIEIEARPFTREEVEEEAKLVGMEPEDLIDGEIDAQGIGEYLALYLDGCEECGALAGSNIMVKLGEANLIEATLVEGAPHD